MNMSVTALPSDARLYLLSLLAPLGEDFFVRGSQMKAAGIDSFESIQKSNEAFCVSQQEAELSRMVQIEVAKERLGNFSPHPYLRDEPPLGYRSSLLQELRKRRAELGNSFDTSDRGKPWLVELDPCRYRRIEALFTQREAALARLRPFDEAHASARREEISRFATTLSAGTADDAKTRRALCALVLHDELSTHGFDRTPARSTRAGTVLEKPVAGGWSLTWSVDYPNLHQPAGSRPEDQHGFLYLYLDLQPATRIATSTEPSIGSAPLRISYNYAAPIDATEWGYGNFSTLPELETLLRAHAKVYAMMSAQIVAALARGLADIGVAD
jgi:hypothetical protein